MIILSARILVNSRKIFRDLSILKRLLRRYEVDKDLQERLILNHLVIIYNVFGIEAANKMVWFKINHEHYHFIKPFLVFLHYLPEDEMIEIGLDEVIVERLRNL